MEISKPRTITVSGFSFCKICAIIILVKKLIDKFEFAKGGICMRKTISLLLIVLFLLVGCTKEINTITDFTKYSDMTRETDRIEVEFDNYSGKPFYFTIEKTEDVNEIMDIIFASSFTKMREEPNATDHTSITIIQGEKEYHIHAVMNKEGDYYYSFSTTDLQLKLNEFARKAGAFDGVE